MKVQNLVVSWLLPGSWRFAEDGIGILDLTYNPPVGCLLCTFVFAVSICFIWVSFLIEALLVGILSCDDKGGGVTMERGERVDWWRSCLYFFPSFLRRVK